VTSSIRISLHPGERIFVNGAVLRVDRKVSMEFLNDVIFLLENHVMQAEEATTPLRQLYFVLQTMLMDPANAASTRAVYDLMHATVVGSFQTPAVLDGLRSVDELVAHGRYFEALKRLRSLFELEDAVMARRPASDPELPPMEEVA
jgi:flagellar protein FlbT